MAGVIPLFTCRRCYNLPGFRNYNGLRAHLRAMHGISQLSPEELSLYETYPGSRSVDHSAPYLNPPAIPAQHSTANEKLSDLLIEVRSCAQSIADSNRQFQGDLQTLIANSIKDSVKVYVTKYIDAKFRGSAKIPTKTSTKLDKIPDNSPESRDTIPKDNTLSTQSEENSNSAEISGETSSSDDEMMQIYLPDGSEQLNIEPIRANLTTPPVASAESHATINDEPNQPVIN